MRTLLFIVVMLVFFLVVDSCTFSFNHDGQTDIIRYDDTDWFSHDRMPIESKLSSF